MKEKIKDKLFKLFFPDKHEYIITANEYIRQLTKVIQKKESEIQTLKRKIRRIERGK